MVLPVLKTHASTVIVLTSSEPFTSGMDTAVFTPLKASADPFLPVVHDGLLIVPLSWLDEASAVVDPDPSLKAKAATGGGGGPLDAGVVAVAGPA